MKPSNRSKKYWLLSAALAVVVGAIALVVSLTGHSPQPPDEIELVARESTFTLAQHPDQPNPALELTKGKPVKLTIRNDEPGKVLHCFTIAGLGVNTTRNLATNESETITFTPKERGTFAYACLLHPSMSGRVVVH